MEMGDEMKYELLLELYNGIYIWIYDEEYDLGVVHLGLRFFFFSTSVWPIKHNGRRC